MAADAITYVNDAAALTLDDLATFFEGWRAAPAPERCLGALTGADACILAYHDDRLVGFATALTDHALFTYIPLVEVARSHRGRGIGSELVRRVGGRSIPSTGPTSVATRTPSGSMSGSASIVWWAWFA